ncbi:putative activator of hydroxyglutaryl-CoA dehydratase [Sulfurospirillum diekertiae]|uniref:Activator of hydroxyglutaryl-CoA dehydratase n=1 Tax=Sulfurospirillum diekertiae TaxID=1854492 RepID=A0A290HZ02_9BACT|nr:acyl-CoA dehydratase activase [Sulfurospirillum diekertiae]ATB70589.1 putative activator of hydroxyglutaryl-CoA dehydratase [Sulfurospirillum diekertiae]
MFWGVDIGSTYTKIIGIGKEREIVDMTVIPTIFNQDKIVGEYLADKEVKMLVATGYGRHMLADSHGAPVISEIKAHAKGAYFFHNDVKTVIDLGGQDSKVIKMGDDGGFTDFRMNDKCAAGTGKFLEIAANRLGLDMQTFANAGFEHDKELTISSMCAVFAESEVISLIAKKESLANICYGVHESIASRLASMAKKFVLNPNDCIVFSGGGALNPFLHHMLELKLERKILIPKHPQLMGAVGAALSGFEVVN